MVIDRAISNVTDVVIPEGLAQLETISAQTVDRCLADLPIAAVAGHESRSGLPTSAICPAERVALPMSDNRHASAHRSGHQAVFDGVSQGGIGQSSARRRGHRRCTQRRGENHIALDTVAAQFRQSLLGELDTAFRLTDGLSATPDAIASSERTQANRMSRRGCPARGTRPAARSSRAADAANRPTPGASAASPIKASTPASASPPAKPRRGRPSHGRASASRAAAERRMGTSSQCAPASRRRVVDQAGEVSPGGGVATLAGGRHRAQPVLVGSRASGNGHWRDGRRRRRLPRGRTFARDAINSRLKSLWWPCYGDVNSGCENGGQNVGGERPPA